MDVYRSRPKGDYLHESTWDELYALTQHWKSDLEFYQHDVQFLRKLINKYFIWITSEENEAKVRKIEANLQKVGGECEDLLSKTKKHLLDLGELVENPDSDEARIFRIEHEHLEDAIAQFVKSFRENRVEVFEITEYVADSEQLGKAFES